MEPNNSRPRSGLIVSIPVSVLLAVLFFMPWVTLSCDPQGLVDMGDLPPGAELPPLPEDLTEPTEIARASGLELAQGQATPTAPVGKKGPALSDDNALPSRLWVWAGLALPALLVAVAALGLAGKMPAVGAGKPLFLLAFAGVIMTYAVSRISYVDDIVDKAREQMTSHIPPGTTRGQASMEQSLDELAERLDDVLLTRATPMLWVAMGAYGALCLCALVVIGSPTPTSRRAIAERSARIPRGGRAQPASTPRPKPPERRSAGAAALPRFGPDLFSPSDSPGPAGRP